MSQCEPGKLLLSTSRNRFLGPEGTLVCWYEDKKMRHVLKNTLSLEFPFSEYFFFFFFSQKTPPLCALTLDFAQFFKSKILFAC